MTPARESDRHRATHDSGFTLIELLVSLALLALILAALPTGLRLAGRAAEATQDLERVSADTASIATIEQLLSRAIPIYEKAPGGGLRIAFEGRSDAVTFLAPLEAGPSGGGLYRFQLSVSGAGLLLQSAPVLSRAAASQSPTWTDERILIPDIDTAAFRYFGAVPSQTSADPGGSWNTNWANTTALPALVELRLKTRRKANETARLSLVELRLR